VYDDDDDDDDDDDFTQKEECCSGIRVTTEDRLHMYRHYLWESQLAELPRFHTVGWQEVNKDI